jgi:hypothetical protein
MDHWTKWVATADGALAAVVGATIRGLLGPGKWDWKEWALSIMVGVACLRWIAPGAISYFGLNYNETIGGFGLLAGMTARPLARGAIAFAGTFAKQPWRRK